MSLVSLALSVVVRHVDEGRCHHGDARALHEDVATVVRVPVSEDFSDRRSLLMNVELAGVCDGRMAALPLSELYFQISLLLISGTRLLWRHNVLILCRYTDNFDCRFSGILFRYNFSEAL